MMPMTDQIADHVDMGVSGVQEVIGERSLTFLTILPWRALYYRFDSKFGPRTKSQATLGPEDKISSYITGLQAGYSCTKAPRE